MWPDYASMLACPWMRHCDRRTFMRLVSSSILGAVEEDRAVRLLAERAVLTRAICCELRDENPDPGSGRSRTALGFLVEWIGQKTLAPSQFLVSATALTKWSSRTGARRSSER